MDGLLMADKNDKVISTALKRFKTAMDAEFENRKNFLDDLKLSCADDQWPDEVKKLRGVHRPTMTFNRLNGVVKQIINDYRQNKLSMRVLPASGDASDDCAEIIGGLLRNIEAQSDADIAYTLALDSAARGGFGYFRIVTEYANDDVFEQDVRIKPIYNPLTVYFDPSARKCTREDAKWCFITEVIPREDFESMYPKVSLDSIEGTGDTAAWITSDGVRVAEYYEKINYETQIVAFDNGMVMEASDEEVAVLAQGGMIAVKKRNATRTKVIWRKMTASTIIEEPREYKTKYIPVIMVPGEEVNVEGKTMTRSAIYYAKDAQRMYNYYRTAATESVALATKAPWLVTANHIRGYEQMWAQANTSPQSYLVYNPDGSMPQRIEPANQPIGEISMAALASDDIKATTGLYDASLGARGNETSGKAILARQQEGDTANYHIIDNLTKAIELCGKVALDFVRITYDTERVARIITPEGEPQTVIVNQQQRDPLTGIINVLNNITVGKYDVVIDTGPTIATQKLELVNAMQQVLPSLPIVGQVAPDLIIKELPFRGAREIAERVKRALPPQVTEDQDDPEAQAMMQQAQAAQAEQQQQVAAIQQGKLQAENARTQATIATANANVLKAHADVQKELIKMQSNRVSHEPNFLPTT